LNALEALGFRETTLKDGKHEAPEKGWRHKVHTIIFETETPAGKYFDVMLLIAILGSLGAVLLESIESIRLAYGQELRYAEWFFTALFTVEYILRIFCVLRPWSYILSFFGVIDLLSILPFFLTFIIEGSHALTVIRGIRLLRVFRVLKLVRYNKEALVILSSIRASLPKILVFMGSVVIIATIVGSLMYIVESDEAGFTSIPMSIYWAIVTMTTVGYGDISPATDLGRFIASFIMILGYGIIAVPTGIITVELANKQRHNTIINTSCPSCSRDGHEEDATFCKYCGYEL
jgi:voltage-gated potassium channel